MEYGAWEKVVHDLAKSYGISHNSIEYMRPAFSLNPI
jgi:hypothetical protein